MKLIYLYFKEHNMENIIKRKTENLPDSLNEAALYDLILRVTKKKAYADKFCFVKCESKDLMDSYSIYDKGDKIVIEANNTLSAAVAFNYYLTEKCSCYFGPVTTNMNLPENPPAAGEKYTQSSRFLYRYFMNYCTFGYTYLFCGWKEYERLLDWAALSGVNLMLNIVGHEIVERDMLISLGYTKEEATAYIAGPAYTPWQWMGNLTSFAGNLPDWWFEKQKRLSIKINERMRELGIGIMMPGFFGLVPLDFKEKFPKSNPAGQGSWCDAFLRQPLLTDTDPMFEKTADAFYNKTKEHFGKIDYFSGDPFHEGGLTDGIDMTAFAEKMCRKMKEHSKGGVWFFQSWGDNPRQEILKGFKKEDVLIGYLRADKTYDSFKGYDGYPYLYMCVQSFGGTRKQDGNIKGFLSEPLKIADKEGEPLAGIGMAMEAVEMDEPTFDLLSMLSVRNDKMEPDEFIKRCMSSRYGYISENLKKVYNLLLDKIYVLTKDHTYSGRESALCARPALFAHNTSYWAAVKGGYTSDTLYEIIKLLLKEYDRLKNNEAYILDLSELLRQLNAELGHEYIDKFSSAWEKGDKETFEKYTEKFLRLFDRANALMGLNSRTRLDNWVKRAENYSEDEEHKALFRFNARNLILLWASKEGAIWLRDYAYREWHGMMPHYKKRWEAFFEELKEQFGTKLNDTIDWAEMDYDFTINNVFYKDESEDKDLLSLADKIMSEKESAAKA